MKRNHLTLIGISILGLVLGIMGCSPGEVKPVDLYVEDMCAQCRMAISDPSFASEILTTDGEAYKFDDIGCMLGFKEKTQAPTIAAIFLKDYETKEWIAYERTTIVQTGVKSPMGSGKVAFNDPVRAKNFQKQHPVIRETAMKDDCGMRCCKEM